MLCSKKWQQHNTNRTPQLPEGVVAINLLSASFDDKRATNAASKHVYHMADGRVKVLLCIGRSPQMLFLLASCGLGLIFNTSNNRRRMFEAL